MPDADMNPQEPPKKRRPRYKGTHPRRFDSFALETFYSILPHPYCDIPSLVDRLVCDKKWLG